MPLASFVFWRFGPVDRQCNKAWKEFVLGHRSTTPCRSIKIAALTGALACFLAAGLEITPSDARSQPSAAYAPHQGKGVQCRIATCPRAVGRSGGTNAASIEPAASRVRVDRALRGSGLASVYSDRRTASGERMNPGAMTAAHRTLPFGSMVTVVNNRNGRSATVRINDRGPFMRGRVIDLSPAAARILGVNGLAPVSLVVGRRA
jgi:rare lipoprotein A